MKKEEFYEFVAPTLTGFWKRLDNDQYLKAWHYHLQAYRYEDVNKVLNDIYAEQGTKTPSIAYVKDRLRSIGAFRSEPVSLQDPEVMSYVMPLRKRFPDKTDDELIDIQNTSNRVDAYKSIVGGNIKIDTAIRLAQENEQKIQEYLESLPPETLALYQQALHVPVHSLFFDWLIYQVFNVHKAGYPAYYNIRSKSQFHCIDNTPFTDQDHNNWINALKIARNGAEATNSLLADIQVDEEEIRATESEIKPFPKVEEEEDDIPF